MSIIKVLGHQHWWLAGRYIGPGKGTFLEVASMVVTWWIVAFFLSALVGSGHKKPTGEALPLHAILETQVTKRGLV